MSIALDQAGRVFPSGGDLEARVSGLLERMAALPPDDPGRAATRAELINACRPMASYLARRYRNRGEPLDDLVQIATVGLIKAVDGFDRMRGVPFSSYAVPTIIGEIKLHFRDRGWALRVPRRLDVPEEDVVAGLACAPAYQALSLQGALRGADGAELLDVLGAADPLLECVEQREALRRLIVRLPQRERRILFMRFFDNMTQSQIAAQTGISQMHVSRLLGRSLRVMREALLAD
jgi:RNA polymerase sigma-B factor